jgi:hypothetical protein
MTDTELQALAADSVGNELTRARDKISNLETASKSSRRIGTSTPRSPISRIRQRHP